MHCFHNISDTIGVDRIMDEFAVAFRPDDAGPAQNSKVLGSYRLFQPQLDVEFCDCQLFVLVQYPNDLLPEFVIKGPKDHRGLL